MTDTTYEANVHVGSKRRGHLRDKLIRGDKLTLHDVTKRNDSMSSLDSAETRPEDKTDAGAMYV